MNDLLSILAPLSSNSRRPMRIQTPRPLLHNGPPIPAPYIKHFFETSIVVMNYQFLSITNAGALVYTMINVVHGVQLIMTDDVCHRRCLFQLINIHHH